MRQAHPHEFVHVEIRPPDFAKAETAVERQRRQLRSSRVEHQPAQAGLADQEINSLMSAVATPRRRHSGNTRSRRTSPTSAVCVHFSADGKPLDSTVSASALRLSPTMRKPTVPMISGIPFASGTATQNARCSASETLRASAGNADQRQPVSRA